MDKRQNKFQTRKRNLQDIQAAVQTLQEANTDVTAKSIAELTGLSQVAVYKINQERNLFHVRLTKKRKSSKHTPQAPKATSEPKLSIKTTEEYRSLIAENYFIHGDDKTEVALEVSGLIASFDQCLFNQAFNLLVIDKVLVEFATKPNFYINTTPIAAKPELPEGDIDSTREEWDELEEACAENRKSEQLTNHTASPKSECFEMRLPLCEGLLYISFPSNMLEKDRQVVCCVLAYLASFETRTMTDVLSIDIPLANGKLSAFMPTRLTHDDSTSIREATRLLSKLIGM